MNKNLIYTVIGYDEKWIEVVELLLQSIIKYSFPFSFDFMIICDESMCDNIRNYFSTSILNIIVVSSNKNSSTSHEVSMLKLDIFKFIKNFRYEKILFIDGDIYSTYTLNNFFDKTLEDDKLYVFYENKNINSHKNAFWSLKNYSDEDIANFRAKNIYVFNCGIFLFANSEEMDQDFSSIKILVNEYSGKFFYEQSIMNYFFNLKGNVDYSIITNENYIMFAQNKQYLGSAIYHFCNLALSGQTKKEIMVNYIKGKIDKIKHFETITEMISHYCRNSKFLEIGVFSGQLFESLYNNSISKLHGVDLFEGTCSSGDQDGNNTISINLDESYNNLLKKIFGHH